MILEIEFVEGSVYRYLDVPEEIYRGILSADSIGKYLNQFVKNTYGYLHL